MGEERKNNKMMKNEEKPPDSCVYRLDQLSVFVRVGHSLWVIIHLITLLVVCTSLTQLATLITFYIYTIALRELHSYTL